jgi:CheY-like chemotaxis protein
LLTDLHLPIMNGFELISRVRTEFGRTALPIVVISGDCDPETPDRICHLGVNAYFSKPFSPAQLCHQVEQLLVERVSAINSEISNA